MAYALAYNLVGVEFLALAVIIHLHANNILLYVTLCVVVFSEVFNHDNESN